MLALCQRKMCDREVDNRFDIGEFALCNFFIQQKKLGNDLPFTIPDKLMRSVFPNQGFYQYL